MKILKSRKALSPVVASIILIAVTVAVSIAVAAWMGALSFSFMGSGEELNLGTPYGWDATGTTSWTVIVNVNCPGGSAVTVDSVRVNGTQLTTGEWDLDINPIAPTKTGVLTLTVLDTTMAYEAGYYYQFVVVTNKNHEFQTQGMAP
jgi:flagellin-like protein